MVTGPRDMPKDTPSGLVTNSNTPKSLFTYVPPVSTHQVLQLESCFNDQLKNELLMVFSDFNPKSINYCIVLKDPLILPIKSVKSMRNFPNIVKLLDSINNSDKSKGLPLNGCVVNFYPPTVQQALPHTDKETYVDQNSSICRYSLGETRTFNIFQVSHYHTRNPSVRNPYISFNLEEGSLMIMDPGSQAITKHHISGVTDNHSEPKPRWSLSFRHFKKVPVNIHQWPYEPEISTRKDFDPLSISPHLDPTQDKSVLLHDTVFSPPVKLTYHPSPEITSNDDTDSLSRSKQHDTYHHSPETKINLNETNSIPQSTQHGRNHHSPEIITKVDTDSSPKPTVHDLYHQSSAPDQNHHSPTAVTTEETNGTVNSVKTTISPPKPPVASRKQTMLKWIALSGVETCKEILIEAKTGLLS